MIGSERRARIVPVRSRPRIGAALQRHLDAAGWSHAELARRARINHSTVSRIVNGTRQTTPQLISRIAAALDLSGPEREELLILGGFVPPRYTEHLRDLAALDGPDRSLVLGLMRRLAAAKEGARDGRTTRLVV